MALAGNVVVTGASSGVGEAVSRRLAAQGMHVFALARRAERLEQLAAEGGGRIHPVAVDVTQVEQVRRAISDIEQRGPIDVLINNAGTNRSGEFVTLDWDDIDRILDTNLKGAMYCTRAVLPGMIARKQGRIINIASVAGTRGIATEATYCASKHGMVGFADALAQEVVGHGILVATLCPGGINTPWWRGGDNRYAGDLNQVLQPDELAELIEFLLKQPSRTMWKRLIFFPTIEWH
jgi:2-hydroxycyclohexanecarboxyl-CoA dehydrogenase